MEAPLSFSLPKYDPDYKQKLTEQQLLELKLHRLKKQVRDMQEASERRNLQLRALGAVGCTGCDYDHLDDALVQEAERQVLRMRRALTAKKFREME